MTETTDKVKKALHCQCKPGPFIDTLLNIAATLGGNIGRTEYGVCDVSVKVHGGRIVAITYSTTENRIEKVAAEGNPRTPQEVQHE